MSAAEETVLPDVPAPADQENEAKETTHATLAATPEGRPKSARERKNVEVFKPDAPKVHDHSIQQVTNSMRTEQRLYVWLHVMNSATIAI